MEYDIKLSMINVVVNGKLFKKKNITGLQRYVIEILKEVDKIINYGEIELLVPRENYNIPNFENIKIIKTRNLPEVFWEQIILPIYAIKNKKTIINMANTAPIVKPDILIIHDIAPIKQTRNFKLLKKIYYRFLYAFNIRNAKEIITVSNFSKKEIAKQYSIKEEKINIISNSWQHMQNIKEKEVKTIKNIKPYFFTLGTLAKHKNMKWVIDAAKKNPNYNFAISGYGKINDKDNQFKNIIYLGYLKDEEMKYVMKNAEGLIFPSFYEGFGIPPLEALALDTKAIVSDIPALKEVYENSVYYIDPKESNINLEEILKKKVDKRDKILRKYNWELSAKQLLELLREGKYESSDNT